MDVDDHQEALLARLADEIRGAGWELALEYVAEGLRDDAIPSLARLGRLGQLGDVPTFISELARELAEPKPGRVDRGSPLAALARDHAREREALGFAPREVVTEFLLLRRVLWRFVSRRSVELGAEGILLAERRLNDTIDQLVAECVVAYFDRATAELADQARHDPLTGLLNHQAFSLELEHELERAKRYGHGLDLVLFDVDDFKQINDTLGHPVGDDVLRRLAGLVRQTLRGSDVAGRMGGDELAALLLESDVEASRRFLARLAGRIDELTAQQEFPPGFAVSAGVAHYPDEGASVEALVKLADTRLYEAKRAK